jgi:ribosomal-protein-alanine N-acetyltransferase
MPNLSLAAPTRADDVDLLAFETRNRSFFERSINARPPEYYSLEGVRKAISNADQDAQAATAFQYLVRDEGGNLVARVNLSRVRRAHFHCAEVGYRVDEAATGKGVAAEAVRQVVHLGFSEHKLHRLEATSRRENVGSVKVLERNGFKQFGTARRSVQLHGVWFDLLYFERHADA